MIRSISVLLLAAFVSTASAHPPWQSTALLGSPDPPLPARATPIFERLTLDQPIGLLDLPGRDLRLLLETSGKLKVFDATTSDPAEATLILDLSAYGDEMGAVRDMTLDPEFEVNGFVYLVWGIKTPFVEGGSRVSRFVIPKLDVPLVDRQSRLDLFTYPSGDHVGSSLRFGPDGYLYIGTGDGSGPNPPDVHKTSQNLGDVRGSILRIDVKDASPERPYQIPSDNPFVNTPGARPEIFSFGVRNAFRIEFDPRQGNLWVADVGWVRCEMLHHTFAGANHGWSLYEGPHTVDPNQPRGPGEIVTPAIVMPRAEAQSITGGVFQPADSPFSPGNYLFGDYMNGAIWAADLSDPKQVTYHKIADTSSKIVSFSQINIGNETTPTPIAIDHRGRILRLESVPIEEVAVATTPFPRKLSETGLYRSLEKIEPAEGVVRYQPVAAMWRDGARSERIVAIPTNEPIKSHRNRRNYSYPTGTVFANTISRSVLSSENVSSMRRMETQVLAFDGFNWQTYTYRWNDTQTDADLVPAFGDEVRIRIADPQFTARDFVYRFQSRDQCKICHHIFHAGAISFTPLNLTGKSGSTDWAKLAADGWVNSNHETKRLQVDPYDISERLEMRARSYLDLNCATCHAPAGAGLSRLNVSFETEISKTASVDEAPLQGNFGLSSASVIVAGHPERSVLMYRMATSGAGHMPHVGSEIPDAQATGMIWDWIADMKPNTQTDVLPTSTSASMMTWHELQSLSSDAAKKRVADIMADAPSPFDAGLFEPWIEPAARQQTIGNRPDIGAILQLSGDARRGASWFADASGAQCRACHRKSGVGVAVGPDLDGIGRKQGRGQILRSLLFPAELIEAPYRSKTFLLNDGSAITGLVVSETAGSTKVKTTDGTIRSVENDAVDEVKDNLQSLMPDGQLAALTAQQVADILEYLMH